MAYPPFRVCKEGIVAEEVVVEGVIGLRLARRGGRWLVRSTQAEPPAPTWPAGAFEDE
jgi:hypothetical protein